MIYRVVLLWVLSLFVISQEDAGRYISFTTLDADGYDQVFVMNVDTGQRTQITDTDAINISDVAWSPDGSKVAYAAWGKADDTLDPMVDPATLYWHDLQTGTTHRFPAGVATTYMLQMRWIDADHLLLVRQSSAETAPIYRVNVAEDNYDVLAEEATFIMYPHLIHAPLLLAFFRADTDFLPSEQGYYRVDIDAGDLRFTPHVMDCWADARLWFTVAVPWFDPPCDGQYLPMDNMPYLPFDGDVRLYRWSFDGRYLAAATLYGELLFRLDGGTAPSGELLYNGERLLDVVWDYDTYDLLVVEGPPDDPKADGPRSVTLINTETGTVTPLITDENIGDVTWLPPGIAFTNAG